ncbi:MAG TPA: hypothetical protein VFB96_25320 [Pirellulaceae bacterium]|nr:hypothetical protein [Pirellulaceae bacterium]
MNRSTTFLAWSLAGLLSFTASTGWSQVQAVPVQPAQGGAAGAYRYANPMGKWLSYALYPQIQKEIEIVPEQRSELEQLRNQTMTKMQELYKKLSEVEQDKRMDRYYEDSKALGAETDKAVEKILLPHQRRRLDQILLQMQMRNTGYGSASALGNEDLTKALGITEEQKERLRQKEQELRAEIQKKTQEFFKKLNEETREELLSVLTPAQRQKLRDLLGSDFEWQWQQSQPVQKSAAEQKRED